MSKNIKKNSKNKKNNLNNYKIESLEPRLLMDASVEQLKNSSNEVFKKSGMFVLH